MLSLLTALRLVPKWVWIALAVAVAFRAAVGWHDAKVMAVWQAGYAQAVADGEKIAKHTDKRASEIATNIRSKTDETSGRIAARADDQRLRGSGKARASCPAVPAPADERPEAGRNSDATGPRLPPEDRATVPWDWLVSRAATCDLNRAEVLAWREWHQRVLEAWPK